MAQLRLGNLDQAEALACEALDIDRRRGDDVTRRPVTSSPQT
jgi:hypothetical protein